MDATLSGLMYGRQYTQGSTAFGGTTLGYGTQPRWGKWTQWTKWTGQARRSSRSPLGERLQVGGQASGMPRGVGAVMALGRGNGQRRCHSGEWRAQGARER